MQSSASLCQRPEFPSLSSRAGTLVPELVSALVLVGCRINVLRGERLTRTWGALALQTGRAEPPCLDVNLRALRGKNLVCSSSFERARGLNLNM